jgi:transcriptional regulator GlxA family with amidase domain
MKHLSILVPEGESNLSSIVGSLKLFSAANNHFISLGKKPVFTIQLVGTAKKVDLYDGLFSIRPQIHFRDLKRTDMVIVPALKGDYAASVKKNKEFSSWIAGQYQQGAELASICTGVFLLASAGLLNGRSCSTHWHAADAFRQLFPGVNLRTDRLITNEQGIYTNGGGFSFLNLLLHLIEKYYDRSTAVFCSKFFEIEIERTSQSPFIIFSGQKWHDDETIKKVQLFIESNTADKISVDGLASRFRIGRRSFDRRFKKATANTPVEYIQRVKVEAAKKNLETSKYSISEVMYAVGYSDTKAFRTIFKKIAGLSPLEYRNKYNKAALAV